MNDASVMESAIAIPEEIRDLLDAPNYVHLSTLRRDGSPRNWIVWVGLEGENVLICTDDRNWKAKDLRRDSRVGLSVADHANPYRMATLSGRVVEVRPDRDCEHMDPIALKYTSEPFPFRYRGPNRVCFVIAIEKAHQRTLDLVHNPAAHSKATRRAGSLGPISRVEPIEKTRERAERDSMPDASSLSGCRHHVRFENVPPGHATPA